jgi:PAS domain S-box-containing protein
MVGAPKHRLDLRLALRDAAIVALCALAYLGSARLGYAFQIKGGVVTLWPPSGVMLGLFLLSRRRDWPAIFTGALAGSFISDLIAGFPLAFSIAAAGANAVESLAVAWYLARHLPAGNRLSTVRAVVALVLRGAVAANAVTAVAGAFVLHRFGQMPLPTAWIVWWAGDGLGMLTVTPVLLVWSGTRAWWRALGTARIFEAAALLIVVAVLAQLTLGPDRDWQLRQLPYMVFPGLFWASLRFGPRGAAVASVLVAAIATWNAALGLGPFLTDGSSIHTALQLYLYLGTVTLSALIPAAVLEERREAGARLVESEERYRSVVTAATDAIVTIDPDSVIEFVNPAVQSIFGYSPTELVGKSLTLLMPEAYRERHRAGIARYLATRRKHIPWQAIELPGLHRDGHEIPLELSFGEIFIGRRQLFTGIIRDISAKRTTEQALRSAEERYRQAQKLEAIGQLAGGIAHDFNNILTAIHGYSTLVKESLAPGSQQREDVGEIIHAAERAEALTRQLLAFSRRQILDPRVIDLGESLRRIVPMLRRLIGEDIEVTVQVPSVECRVRADPGQVEQVILNLAINARDAMPNGGRLTLDVSNVDAPDVEDQSDVDIPAGPLVRLAVIDTGTGMDATTIDRIFEPFFTTKPAGKGTGLGLATVHGVVQQSGGSISVHSEVGRGTRFTVYLPRVYEHTDDHQVPSLFVDRKRSETILLAEDDEALRNLARRILEKQGYVVLAAQTPAEALRLASDHPSRIDLLLTDVVLPGANGRELAEAITARNPSIRVLYMSGYTDDAIVKRGVLEHEMHFLAKPFEPESLLRKVAAVLDGPSGRPGHS